MMEIFSVTRERGREGENNFSPLNVHARRREREG